MVTSVITVGPQASVQEVAGLLLTNRISGLPVVSDQGDLVGIVSEGDLLHRAEAGTGRRRPWWLAILTGRDVLAAEYVREHSCKVADVMTRHVITATPDTSLQDIAHLLEKNGIKRVPIVAGGRLVGIVSRANLLHGLIARPGGREPVEDSGERDRRIRAEVQEVMAKNPWLEREHMNLVVSDGVVHVWGIVRSEEHRNALRAALRAIPGVLGVEDHLSPNWFANTTS
jgi:CBS domain-containing protein